MLQGLQEELEAAEKKLGNIDGKNPAENETEEGNESKEQTNGIQKEASTLTTHSQSSVNTTSTDTSDQLPMMEFKEWKQEYGVVYILYIRFAMRSEGLDSSRAVFSRARKDKFAPWEVYEAAALMEYHVAKQLGVANRIFNRALDRFKGEVEFVIRYLTFLLTVNDDNSEPSKSFVPQVLIYHMFQMLAHYLSKRLEHSLRKRHARFGSAGPAMNINLAT